MIKLKLREKLMRVEWNEIEIGGDEMENHRSLHEDGKGEETTCI